MQSQFMEAIDTHLCSPAIPPNPYGPPPSPSPAQPPRNPFQGPHFTDVELNTPDIQGCSNPNFGAIMSSVTNIFVSAMTRQQDGHGRYLPPFIPGEYNSPRLSTAQATALADELVQGCGRNNQRKSEYLSQEVLDVLGSRLENANTQCKNDLAEFMRSLLNSHSIQDRYVCTQHVNECHNHDLAVANTVAALRTAGLTGLPEVNRETLINICRDEPGQLSDPLHVLLKGSEAASNCVPLKPSEARRSTIDNQNIPSNYTLRRLTDDTSGETRRQRYQAVIDFDFRSTDSELITSNLTSVRDCFTQAIPGMTGPNGEQIELKMYSDLTSSEQAVTPRPMSHRVNLHATYPRANSRNWSVPLDCSTIVHESLHVLGLCDHYGETSMGTYMAADGTRQTVNSITDVPRERRSTFLPMFNCRFQSSNPDDDIMANSPMAYERALAQYEITMCVCRQDDVLPVGQRTIDLAPDATDEQRLAAKAREREAMRTCISQLESFQPGGTCPATTHSFRSRQDIAVGTRKSTSVVTASRALNANERQSMFSPAQFRYMLGAGCPLGTRRFRQCESQAYMSAPTVEQCPQNLRQICAHPSWTQ